jgi:hypothetical protein
MTEIDAGWGSQTLPIGSHVCSYCSGEEALRDSLAFLRVGLDREGEVCVLFADTSRQPVLLEWLAEGYPGDLASRIEDGRLVLIAGAPTIDLLVARIVERLDTAVAGGCRIIRFLGFIAWVMAGWPSDDELLEFEARVNEVVTRYPAVIVCTYAIPALAGPTLIYGGLQTHPLVGVDQGRVVANPMALPVADVLDGITRRARRASRTGCQVP